MKNKAQVTIFIIIGVVVIAIIALLLFLTIKTETDTTRTPEKNTEQIFKECLEDDLRKAIKEISLQGGTINDDLSKKFKFENEPYRNISYLCYTARYYQPCNSQTSLLIKHLRQELKSEIENNVRECFSELTTQLDKEGYTVDSKYNDFSLELLSGRVELDLDAKLTLTRSGETTKKNDFKLNYPSMFYDNAIIAQEISSQEAKYCNFEELGFMILHPETNIKQLELDDSTTIYTIKNKRTREKFRFAIRSCAIPT